MMVKVQLREPYRSGHAQIIQTPTTMANDSRAARPWTSQRHSHADPRRTAWRRTKRGQNVEADASPVISDNFDREKRD